VLQVSGGMGDPLFFGATVALTMVHMTRVGFGLWFEWWYHDTIPGAKVVSTKAELDDLAAHRNTLVHSFAFLEFGAALDPERVTEVAVHFIEHSETLKVLNYHRDTLNDVQRDRVAAAHKLRELRTAAPKVGAFSASGHLCTVCDMAVSDVGSAAARAAEALRDLASTAVTLDASVFEHGAAFDAIVNRLARRTSTIAIWCVPGRRKRMIRHPTRARARVADLVCVCVRVCVCVCVCVCVSYVCVCVCGCV
jgi:hypothetical protein